MNPIVTQANPDDLPAVLNLLAQARLPRDGVAEHFSGFMVARADGCVVGAIGLETYGQSGLVRSLAVDPRFRGTGLGIALTQAMLEHGRRGGLRTLYLLTETAATFFPRFGFRAIGRDAVEPAVRASVEFVAACPQSAACMALDLVVFNPPVEGPDRWRRAETPSKPLKGTL